MDAHEHGTSDGRYCLGGHDVASSGGHGKNLLVRVALATPYVATRRDAGCGATGPPRGGADRAVIRSVAGRGRRRCRRTRAAGPCRTGAAPGPAGGGGRQSCGRPGRCRTCGRGRPDARPPRPRRRARSRPRSRPARCGSRARRGWRVARGSGRIRPGRARTGRPAGRAGPRRPAAGWWPGRSVPEEARSAAAEERRTRARSSAVRAASTRLCSRSSRLARQETQNPSSTRTRTASTDDGPDHDGLTSCCYLPAGGAANSGRRPLNYCATFDSAFRAKRRAIISRVDASCCYLCASGRTIGAVAHCAQGGLALWRTTPIGVARRAAAPTGD